MRRKRMKNTWYEYIIYNFQLHKTQYINENYLSVSRYRRLYTKPMFGWRHMLRRNKRLQMRMRRRFQWKLMPVSGFRNARRPFLDVWYRAWRTNRDGGAASPKLAVWRWRIDVWWLWWLTEFTEFKRWRIEGNCSG